MSQIEKSTRPRNLIDYPLVDADCHYYEPDDCYTRHIDPEFKEDAISVVRGVSKHAQVQFRGNRIGFFSAPPGEFAGKPGSYKAFYQDKNHSGRHILAADPVSCFDIPESMNRDLRLKWFDEHNVEAGFFFPSLGVGVEMALRDGGPEVVMANYRSFNKWIQDDWGWDYQGRIFSAAQLSLVDLNLALSELDRVIKEGARIVNLVAGPVMGRSPADPHFDPFWARCEEAGILVTFHVGDAGYEELVSTAWGEKPRPQHHRITPFQHVIGMMDRPIQDTIAALILHNLFGRFPRLRVASIENGSSWVAPLLKKLDRTVRLAGNNSTFGPLTARPSEIFYDRFRICPFPEDDIPELIESVGTDVTLFGSDWPHPEGLITPIEFADELEGLNYHQVRQVMRSNTADIIGLSK
ncbi:MAG: amidohydrolase [Pseudomonadales bacterium]|nr:amidohydrolase [Pseudomonadales bacterium]